jgi:hypothetical protein
MRFKKFPLILLFPTFLVLFSVNFFLVPLKDIINFPWWSDNKLDYLLKASGNLTHLMSPNTKTTLMQPSSLCKDQKNNFLIIFIQSAVRNFKRRRQIRKTWGDSNVFNYPKFYEIHDSKVKKYGIKSSDWKNYTLNSNQPIHLSMFRIQIVFLIGVEPIFTKTFQNLLELEQKKNGIKIINFIRPSLYLLKFKMT